MKNLKAFAVTGLLIAIPLLAAAQITEPVTVQGNALSQLLNLINRLATIMLTILIVVAAVFIIYAGYLYLTAGGDSEKVSKASKTIIFAAVAIGVGLLAKVITALAEQFTRRQI